jgi:hypothetical protein
MATATAHLARLTSARNELEAAIVVNALEDEGIKGVMSGVHTTGFRAEAPGWVEVLVTEEDMPRAQRVLNHVRPGEQDIDWSTIDVGEPEEPVVSDTTPQLASLRLWRRIVFVFVVIWIIWIAAGIGAELIGMLLRAIGIWP